MRHLDSLMMKSHKLRKSHMLRPLIFKDVLFFEKSHRLHQSHLLVWLLIRDQLDSLLMKSHKLHESHMLRSLISWKANIFLRNQRSNTNRTGLLEYQYEIFGLPYDEITQVTRITHVTVPNFLKKFFLVRHKSYTNYTGC